MLTMDYVDFQCSLRGCRKEFYEILLMSAFVAVLAVVVKNHLNSNLCQLWIIWTSISVLWVVVNSYIDFCYVNFHCSFSTDSKE